ncbi:N-acetylglucosamine-6-phosphate deacetylase [Ferruginibacter sp. HRS2-29]|uniref:N-acetylglucosamine-6-phosphate deacetylase n=1 Tax=Ferruginibacter sp. HRS2-29 TaxID=2487334 RepID=UPI0020CD1975|nr:N-acetylglucosamine-6-phosphate deacetylase [Ferruginibacter sp. HRS2-29]MCP9749897.1 N-acetylglucosamine-6-phosphate deacetylase [Ferruginibacter sp. HRS2-29]
MQTAISNCTIFTGEEIIRDAVIVTEQDIIIAIQKEIPPHSKHIDLGGKNIAAGFLDIQVNGGHELYFSEHLNEAAIHDICQASLQYGTTHVLPCLISSSQENILKGIETVKHFMHTHGEGVVGMHLEGPFINPAKRGAHVKELVRKPTNAELEEIIKYGCDVIKVMTIAPECFTDAQLDMLLESGIVLSAGHSEMTCEQALRYFDKGIRLVTHLYNAMTQMEHRAPGLVGATFTNGDVYAPIILDGAHCDYAAAKIALKQKEDKLFLISDAAFLGRKVQSFSWGNFDATLMDGFYRNKEGKLAGAAISMAEAVQNAMQYLEVSLVKAIAMATVHPAKAIGMENNIGYIKPGYQARFVVFNDEFSQYETLIA